jgi:hypothetical protein|tara:strand:+ start:550 stop:789 length:240 start_codon:yes stop_codon:yes gene_type:complete
MKFFTNHLVTETDTVKVYLTPFGRLVVWLADGVDDSRLSGGEKGKAGTSRSSEFTASIDSNTNFTYGPGRPMKLKKKYR